MLCAIKNIILNIAQTIQNKNLHISLHQIHQQSRQLTFFQSKQSQMLTVVSLQIKLFAIVLLAIMNMLLIRRKKNEPEQLQTYTLNGQMLSYNIAENRTNDIKGKIDSSKTKYNYQETIVDVKETRQGHQIGQQNQNMDEKFFVKLEIKRVQQHNQQKAQRTSQQLNNHFVKKSQSEFQQMQQSQQSKQKNSQELKQVSNNPETQNPVVTDKQNINQIFSMDLQIQSKDEVKSQKQSIQKQHHLNQCNHLSSTQRKKKVFQQNYPSEAQSQSESDSHTKKTEIIFGNKQTYSRKFSAQKNQISTPKQSLKRCLQQFIYSTFEQMIESDSLQQKVGRKKKKRSL